MIFNFPAFQRLALAGRQFSIFKKLSMPDFLIDYSDYSDWLDQLGYFDLGSYNGYTVFQNAKFKMQNDSVKFKIVSNILTF